jgi:hypothetical protein
MMRRLGVFSIVGMLVLQFALVDSQVFAASLNLSNISTNEDFMKYDSGTKIVSYILANTRYTHSPTVELAAYYDTWNNSNQITIRRPTPGTEGVVAGFVCNTVGGSNSNWIQVTIQVPGVGQNVQKIKRDDVCGGSNKFYDTFNIPNGTPARDAGTGKYVVNITIEYISGNVPERDNQQVLFRVKANNGLMAAKKDSVMGTDSGRRLAAPGNLFSKQVFPFGTACSATVPVDGTVRIKDPDNYFGGDPGSGAQKGKAMYFYVEEDTGSGFNPLSSGRYFNKKNIKKTSTVGGDFVLYPNQVSGDSSIAHFMMQPNAKYRLYIKDVYQNNTLQVQIPENSIYYAVDCRGPEFRLTPSVSVNPVGIIEQGGVVDVTGTVAKVGDTTPQIDWQLSKIIVAPGGSIPSALTDSANSPATHYGNTWSSAGSGRRSFSGASTPVIILNDTPVDEVPAGSRICWALSVKPPTQDKNLWRHSAPVCVKVGKRPKLVVLGGDVRVRGEIGTSITTLSRGGAPTVFGSWVEYGVFSARNNEGLASGAGLRQGNTNTAQLGWSNLTFANLDSASISPAFGNYASNLPSVPDVTSYFTDRISPGSPLLRFDTSGVYKTGDLSIDSPSPIQINKGKSVVIVATGKTVRINQNIMYENTAMTSLADIPQLVIIASKIIINEGVDRVDAWLIATDYVNTCSAVTEINLASPALTVNKCNLPLVVNGPVATKKLYLYRTAGSGPAGAAGDPAESFNFRPEASLWAYNYGLALLQPVTSSVTGLPPRF